MVLTRKLNLGYVKMASSIAMETKDIITGLLISSPLRCTIQQLCTDFYAIVGYRIPIRQLGFVDVEQYLRSIPDTVRVYGSGSSARVEAVIKSKSAHINAMVVKQRTSSIPDHKKKFLRKPQNSHQQLTFQAANRAGPSTQFRGNSNGIDYCPSRVPKDIQNNLRKIILKFPSGIECSKLPIEYNNMFNKTLCYQRWGYRSLMEMCTDLPDIFHFFNTTDDFILYDKNNPIPSFDQNDQQIVQKQPGSKFDWESALSLIPSDVMALGDVIPQRHLEQCKEIEVFDICIGEIYNPTNFWIYSDNDEFKSFVEEMQTFFDNQRNKYVIPELLLEKGLYCACFFANAYHRIAVVDLQPQVTGFVRVFFIDYGSVGNVPSKDLWYLPKKFGDFPSQGIKATLSNIRPVMNEKKERKWSIEAINKFKKHVTNTSLAAQVTSTNTKENILEIYLAVILDESNIFYLNERLVDEGYGDTIKKVAA